MVEVEDGTLLHVGVAGEGQEGIRAGVDVASWIVLGHSWGSDLAVRYAVDHPDSVVAVVGLAGRGPQRDSTWCKESTTGSTPG